MSRPGNRPRLSTRKKLFFSVALVAACGLLGLAAIEAYIRIAHSHVDLFVLTGRRGGTTLTKEGVLIDAFCAFRPRPGQVAEEKTVNGHGFFSTPELELNKAEDTIRIVFLGGSSTAGTGLNLSDEETWPWKTWELLGRAHPSRNIEFINAAVSGYSSFESFGRLWSRIRFFDPDISVVCHGWNEMYYFDLCDDMTSWRRLADGSWSLERTRRPVVVYEPLWIDEFIRPSQALTRIRLRLSTRLTGEVGPAKAVLATDFDQRGLEVWRTNLRLLRETALILDAKLLVAKSCRTHRTRIVPVAGIGFTALTMTRTFAHSRAYTA